MLKRLWKWLSCKPEIVVEKDSIGPDRIHYGYIVGLGIRNLDHFHKTKETKEVELWAVFEKNGNQREYIVPDTDLFFLLYLHLNHVYHQLNFGSTLDHANLTIEKRKHMQIHNGTYWRINFETIVTDHSSCFDEIDKP